MEAKANNVKAWMSKIELNDMPSLAPVVRQVSELTNNSDTSIDQLAEEVLKDSAMTAQVLRIANSVKYNPTAIPIKTISRAVFVIGINQLKSICQSSIIIDKMLKEQPSQAMLNCIARSFHAAVQAKNIASHLSEHDQEQAFIAALLYHLSEMAIFACGGQQAKDFDQAVSRDKNNIKALAKEMLGINLNRLTLELTRSWNVSDLLCQCLKPTGKASSSMKAVLLGEAVSQMAEQGWQSEKMENLIDKISKFTGQDPAETKSMLLASADEAANTAADYGASQVIPLIPDSSYDPPAEPEVITPQNEQLNALQELSRLIIEKADINRIFHTVLQGIHRGLNMDRACIMLFNTNRDRLETRYASGKDTGSWRELVQTKVQESDRPNEIFAYALNRNSSVWLGGEENLEHLRSNGICKFLPSGDCFIAAVNVGQRQIGVFYSDKVGGKLFKSEFDTFQLFVQQTNMALTLSLSS
jgi:HD-like signal output (HDOD) protein